MTCEITVAVPWIGVRAGGIADALSAEGSHLLRSMVQAAEPNISFLASCLSCIAQHELSTVHLPFEHSSALTLTQAHILQYQIDLLCSAHTFCFAPMRYS